MTDDLDFLLVREEFPDRWARADPRRALIERLNRYGWKVVLRDGASVHHVGLAVEDGQHVGWCKTLDDGTLRPCKGQEYHDGPCAHLCTVRKAAVVGVPDTHGQPVQIAPVDDPEQARADHHVDAARTDGGDRRV